jgi:hypothetical protein
MVCRKWNEKEKGKKKKKTTSCILLRRREETKGEKKTTIKSHDATAFTAREKNKEGKKELQGDETCCLEERAKVRDIHNKTQSSMCCACPTRTKRKED